MAERERERAEQRNDLIAHRTSQSSSHLKACFVVPVMNTLSRSPSCVLRAMFSLCFPSHTLLSLALVSASFFAGKNGKRRSKGQARLEAWVPEEGGGRERVK